MSDSNLARRTDVEVSFDGVAITETIRPYILSLTYTDTEDGESDDLQIQLQDREGNWLQSWLEQAVNTAAETAAAETEEETEEIEVTTYTYKVTAKIGLNVRSGPSTSYSKLGALAYGATVTSTGVSNGWATITYGGSTAYICADYIQLVSTETTTASASSDAAGQYKVTAKIGLNVRSGPGTGYSKIGAVEYGATVDVSSVVSGWGVISYGSSTGYVSMEYLELISGEDGESAASAMTISAAIVRRNWNGDGGDDVLDCGQFELDCVTADGPPSTVTIKGTALPFTATIRQQEKTKGWEAYYLSKIAEEIAGKNGMACMYESSSDPYYERVEQYKTSDIDFLSMLCDREGISLKAMNNIVILYDQVTYEQKDTIATFDRLDGTILKYKLSTGKADTEYASCRVSYTTASGECISGTAYVEDYDEESESNQQLEITEAVSTTAEAKQMAEKYLRLHNKYAKQATLTLPGNTGYAAGATVNLTGFGLWDAKYIISQAQHSVSTSGYTTTLTCRAVLEGY